MRSVMVVCLGLLVGAVAAAQTVEVVGFDIDAGNGVKVCVSLQARVTRIVLDAGDINRGNGGTISSVGDVRIDRNGAGLITGVGNVAIGRDRSGAVTSVGSIRIERNGQGLVTRIGNASVGRNGVGLVTSVGKDPRVRLVLGGDAGW